MPEDEEIVARLQPVNSEDDFKSALAIAQPMIGAVKVAGAATSSCC